MEVFREEGRRVAIRALTGAEATVRGSRIAGHGNSKHSLQVTGIATATVHLDRSNKPDPDETTDADWESLGSVTADGFIDALDKPAVWLRARVSAYTSGTINADLASGG